MKKIIILSILLSVSFTHSASSKLPEKQFKSEVPKKLRDLVEQNDIDYKHGSIEKFMIRHAIQGLAICIAYNKAVKLKHTKAATALFPFREMNS